MEGKNKVVFDKPIHKFSKTFSNEKLESSLNSISELNSLPSLSEHSEEESSTLTPEQIQKILKTSQIINSQVRLRLKSFVQKVKTIDNVSHTDSTYHSNLNGKNPKKNSIVIDQEHLNQIKSQQNYLLSLFEQLKILQSEVETSYATLSSQQQNENSFETRQDIGCCVQALSPRGQVACKCSVF